MNIFTLIITAILLATSSASALSCNDKPNRYRVRDIFTGTKETPNVQFGSNKNPLNNNVVVNLNAWANEGIEVNGSRGSLAFDFEDMNRLKFYRCGDPEAKRGFRDILVTEPVHPYVGAWWPPGHIIGFEHTFVHTFADFLNAAASGKKVSPDFEDGLRNQQVLEAVERSAKSRRWERIRS